MGEAVLKINKSGYAEVSNKLRLVSASFSQKAPSREIMILGAILIVLQIFDGILTTIGVNTFGISSEGNQLLRFMMEQWGAVPTLIASKGLAIISVVALCAVAPYVKWLPKAMKAVICVYLFAAVLPWAAILIHTNL